MNDPKQPLSVAKTQDEQLSQTAGILHASTDPESAQVEIEFNPAVISDEQVRSILHDHITRVETLRQQSFRLESNACEACAQKLEKRVGRMPGIRRATATYAGRILSVTFDSNVQAEAHLEADLQKSGANIKPLASHAEPKKPLISRMLAGELNDEISCALGFIFLISGLITSRFSDVTWVSNTLFAAAYFFAGQEGVRSAYASLKERVLDVDVLMVLAALGAAWIGHPFEGALLLFLFSFSNVLQSHALNRTQRAIESLLTLRPSQALVKRDGSTIKIAVEELQIDDIVIVRPGEQIPIDGILVEGSTHVDESSLTGESMPVSKSVGNSVFTGTMNQRGGIELRVTKRSEDSTLARMVKLVAEAQAEKSETQRFLERAEQYYAMGVIGFTAAVFFIPYLFQGESFSEAFYRAMTIMVVASPCALIISTPATVLSAIGGAARQGILIKGGSHMERAAHIDIVAIDKTGTLTFGKPTLTQWVHRDGLLDLETESLPEPIRNLLGIAAGVEAKSEHPLADAIVNKAKTLGIEIPEASDFQSTAGKGAEATIAQSRYLIGSERSFRELKAEDIANFEDAAKSLQSSGKTCVWLGSRDGDKILTLAVLALADTLRPEAKLLTQQLKRLGVRKVVMLTGDQRLVAEAIAKEAGVDEVHAELLPEDKLNVIRKLKENGRVMMIGDGVNDAPALAIADIGVAMGAAGTDVAMETADVILMGDKLDNIPRLLDHTRRARRVLMQNLIFSSAVIVLLVAGTLGFTLALPLGVIGHEGSTVLVCLNGLRLLMMRPLART